MYLFLITLFHNTTNMVFVGGKRGEDRQGLKIWDSTKKTINGDIKINYKKE